MKLESTYTLFLIRQVLILEDFTIFIYEFVTFIVAIVLVEFSERKWPADAIDRKDHFSLNFLALTVVMVGSKISDYFVHSFLNYMTFSSFFYPIQVLRGLSSVPKIICGLLIVDFLLYWVHRAMHVSPLLWKTHRFHHTPKKLFWLSGSRTSFLHLFLFAIPEVVVPFGILKMNAEEAAIGFSIAVVVNLWVHTNLKINLGPLGWFFITPDYHRIHHASNHLSDTNLGFIHTLWDRLFGTYVDPKTVETPFQLGINDGRAITLRTILGV